MQDQLSSGSSAFPKFCVPLSVSASSVLMFERPLGYQHSSSAQLFNSCPKLRIHLLHVSEPAAVSPLSDLSTYSNSSDQEFIFSNTGQDCMELYPKNIRCRAQRQQKNELVQFYFTCISTEAWSYSS